MSPYWVQGVRTLPVMCGNLGTGLEMNGKWAFLLPKFEMKISVFLKVHITASWIITLRSLLQQ